LGRDRRALAYGECRLELSRSAMARDAFKSTSRKFWEEIRILKALTT